MTQHTLKVNTAFPVSSHLARTQHHGFLVSFSTGNRIFMMSWSLPKKTSCEVNRRCLACDQFLHRDVFYIMTRYQGLKSCTSHYSCSRIHVFKSYTGILHIFHCSQTRHSSICLKTLKFSSRDNFTGWHIHWYDRTLLSLVLQTLYHKKRAGQFINPVLRCCLDGNNLLRWRGGYLPLTEYSEHPFRLVTRALGGKREREMSDSIRRRLRFNNWILSGVLNPKSSNQMTKNVKEKKKAFVRDLPGLDCPPLY